MVIGMLDGNAPVVEAPVLSEIHDALRRGSGYREDDTHVYREADRVNTQDTQCFRETSTDRRQSSS